MVTVIVVLIGLFAAIAKPLLNLNTSMTQLTTAVDHLNKRLDEITDKNRKAHDALFDTQREHIKRLDDHEGRLGRLEDGEYRK